MSIELDESLLSYYRNSYLMKAREFRKELVSKLQFMGCALIIVCQIKFGGSIILFVVRMIVQSLLGSPYPSKERLATIASNYTVAGLQTQNSEPVMHQAFVSKLQRGLLHVSLTFNIFIILIGILFPFDFELLLGNYRMPGIPNLANTPSPYNNNHNLIEGEFRGYFFAQYIGERIPINNFYGNVSYLFWQFAILCCQLGLYLLTVIELSPLRDDDEQKLLSFRPSDISDGYSGNVIAFETNPKMILEQVIDNKFVENEMNIEQQQQQQQQQIDSMV